MEAHQPMEFISTESHTYTLAHSPLSATTQPTLILSTGMTPAMISTHVVPSLTNTKNAMELSKDTPTEKLIYILKFNLNILFIDK